MKDLFILVVCVLFLYKPALGLLAFMFLIGGI